MFVFPFTTCEIPENDSFVKQPFSAFINFLSSIILIYFAFCSKTTCVQWTLFSYFLFEIWHTFSHIQHLEDKTIQTNVVHVLGYLIAFSSLWSIEKLSGQKNSTNFYIILSLIVCIDIFTWFKIKGISTIFTGLFIFAFIVFGSIHKLSPNFKKSIPFLISGLILLFVLFVNENRNCQKMLEYKKFPYHAIIEVVGLVLFTTLALLFLDWEKNL